MIFWMIWRFQYNWKSAQSLSSVAQKYFFRLFYTHLSSEKSQRSSVHEITAGHRHCPARFHVWPTVFVFCRSQWPAGFQISIVYHIQKTGTNCEWLVRSADCWTWCPPLAKYLFQALQSRTKFSLLPLCVRLIANFGRYIFNLHEPAKQVLPKVDNEVILNINPLRLLAHSWGLSESLYKAKSIS